MLLSVTAFPSASVLDWQGSQLPTAPRGHGQGLAPRSTGPRQMSTCFPCVAVVHKHASRWTAHAACLISSAACEESAVSTGGSNSGRGNLGFLKKKLREHFACSCS